MISIEDAMRDYVRDVAQHLSSQTAATYEQGMRRFKEFLESIHHSPSHNLSTLSVDHALDCARWLNDERGISKSTLKTYLASISQFYTYLLQQQIVDLPAVQIERMRSEYHHYREGGSRHLPQLAPDEAITSLLNAAQQAKPQPSKPRLDLIRLRNIAMLEALRSSGMRVGELVSLKLGNIDKRHRSAHVMGKSNEQRVVYFDDKAWRAIQEYLKMRNDAKQSHAQNGLPVFARHDRRVSGKILCLTTDTVRLVFNALAREANIEITMTPQSFRHAFATRILETTGDLAVVQDMLGHSSPETTRVYTKTSTTKQMRAVHRTAFGDHGKDNAQELAEIIFKGENDLVEFKVAARWNPHTKKKDDSLKDNILQAVAAFMNRNGGTIIIGVNDKGVVVGLEEDYAAADPHKCDRDGYEMFLRNIIRDNLEVDSTLYKVIFHQINEREVCQLKIEPAPKPIYFDGDLYVRDGNRKEKLKAKDAISYIKEHWSDSS